MKMNKLFYLKPAQDNTQTLPLGNGHIGAMLYSGVKEDIYALNDDTLWSGYPKDTDNPLSSAYLEKIRQLTNQGKYLDAQKTAERWMYGSWGQSYLPTGNLRVTLDHDGYDSYKRILSLDNAVHTVEYINNGVNYFREAFISYPDDIMCIRYTANGASLSMNIAVDSKLKNTVKVLDGMLILEGQAPGDCVPEYMQAKEKVRYNNTAALQGMRYEILVYVLTDTGTVSSGDGSLAVSDAHTVQIYISVNTSFKSFDTHPYLEGADCHKKCSLTMKRAVKKSFEALKRRHIKDYRGLFCRLELDLGKGFDGEPSDKRLYEFKNRPDDLSLYSLMYQYGRYLLISSSRPGTQPANLQGIWNEQLPAPWSCNYTTNINVQMNYWGALGANLAECCTPLNEMIGQLAQNGQKTAKTHYGADGFCVHHNTDLWRMTSPVGSWGGGTTRYAYFPLAGAWLTRHLYEYYMYTLDRKFLDEYAYGLIKMSAAFCDSMLVEDGEKLIFSPAASPENMFVVDGQKCAMSKYSAMYQSIVIDAFNIFLQCSEILDRDTEYADYIRERLKNVQFLEIGSSGQILEWDRQFIESDPHHRHLSQLYALYPAKMIDSKELADACRRSLELRGDEGTGWSCVWKMCLWACLNDGNRALSLLDRLMTPVITDQINFKGGGTYPNLLNAHPPFQIDGSLGLVAGINEMLARFENGAIILLPALADKWKNGSVRGLKVDGGYTVDLKWTEGVLKYAYIHSLSGDIPKVIYNGAEYKNAVIA